MQGDTKAAVEFLSRYAQNGPWALTAIQTDRKAITTRTFTDLTKASEFVEQHNGKRNIYFHVNPVLREVSKKAEREDIKEVAWLHVDIDPRAGENIEEEQQRALGLLTDNLPDGVPAPTVVVFSGGGYQGFWALKEPIKVEGDLTKAEDAKRYNQQLEVLFGADHCHNIDRIMRLPGTVNIPDTKKRRKGREEVLAELVEFNDDNVYPLNQFTAAPAVQMADESGFGSVGGMVNVSGNIDRLADIDELDEWNVPDRVKVVLVQGSHPDEAKAGDNSRSAWVFDAVCQLVRHEVPDDTIFSILTDPDFGISESVIEKGGNAEKYAKRQIERAKEEAIDPWLRKLNEQHAVIGNLGGKCRVVEEVMDHALQRTRLTRQSFEDLRNRYMHIKVSIGNDKQGMPVLKPLGQWWLQNQNRRQYETIVFAPGQEMTGVYNLWKGFACQSKPGDCSLFLDHLFHNVCQGVTEHYEYFLQWMARAVQRPDAPGEVAVVMRGGRGTGKSFAAKEFGKVFGRHFLHVSNSSHLVGNFNSHLRDVVFLFADEAFYAGDRKHASILKTLITEETITIEAKGVDAEAAPNYVHLIMASNDLHVIPAGGDERRFFVLEVGKEQQQKAAYFRAISEQLENGGREALLHCLMTMDLSEFQVRDVPRTDALKEQKLLSMSVEEEWWYNKLVEAQLVPDHEEWHEEIRIEELVDDYIEYTRRWNVSKRGNATALGRFLSRVCPRLDRVQRKAVFQEPAGDGWSRKVERRAYFWQLPTLEGAREQWEELYGKQDW